MQFLTCRFSPIHPYIVKYQAVVLSSNALTSQVDDLAKVTKQRYGFFCPVTEQVSYELLTLSKNFIILSTFFIRWQSDYSTKGHINHEQPRFVNSKRRANHHFSSVFLSSFFKALTDMYLNRPLVDGVVNYEVTHIYHLHSQNT